MRYKQCENENTDNYVKRARHKGSLCDFGEGKPDETIIELIIVSTPSKYLQKQLLDQDKGYTIDDARIVHFHIHRDSIQLTRTTVTIATTLDAGRSAAEKRNEMKDSRKTEVRRELACQ